MYGCVCMGRWAGVRAGIWMGGRAGMWVGGVGLGGRCGGQVGEVWWLHLGIVEFWPCDCDYDSRFGVSPVPDC